jgi:hypothetical protein
LNLLGNALENVHIFTHKIKVACWTSMKFCRHIILYVANTMVYLTQNIRDLAFVCFCIIWIHMNLKQPWCLDDIQPFAMNHFKCSVSLHRKSYLRLISLRCCMPSIRLRLALIEESPRQDNYIEILIIVILLDFIACLDKWMMLNFAAFAPFGTSEIVTKTNYVLYQNNICSNVRNQPSFVFAMMRYLSLGRE